MQVLVDTSVWIDYLRRADARLAGLLQEARVLMHPAVLGELACGKYTESPKASRSLVSPSPRCHGLF